MKEKYLHKAKKGTADYVMHQIVSGYMTQGPNIYPATAINQIEVYAILKMGQQKEKILMKLYDEMIVSQKKQAEFTDKHDFENAEAYGAVAIVLGETIKSIEKI